ncbi:MAG: cobalt-precorrin 5A hydrolase [Desulfobacteraceae bacterium]|nr:cobalt-precorrin 5A hydrolase [Desulfobacteraceae bacterium]
MVSDKLKKNHEASVAIVTLTRNGANLAMRLHSKMPGSTCYVPVRHRFAIQEGAVGFGCIGDIFPYLWTQYRAFVCIMATGIVVRQIAPLVRHKAVDPAVVVLDERGQYAISLVSGHLGGGNRLAKKVAKLLGGKAVITTASDVQKKPAVDLTVMEVGLEIESMERTARVARAILEDEPVWVFDPERRLIPYLLDYEYLVILPKSPCSPGSGSSRNGKPQALSANAAAAGSWEPDWPGQDEQEHAYLRSNAGIWVSETFAPPDLECLEVRPRNLVVGVGCNRGTPAEEILDHIREVFRCEGLSLKSIRELATADIKEDEPGILEAAAALDRPVRFHTPREIDGIAVPTPSEVVEAHIGVSSVCEASALLSARSQTLIVTKRKTPNVTVAVARVAFP